MAKKHSIIFYAGEVPVQGTAKPGLVLLDLKLPTLDDIQVLSTIRSSPELAGIAVVILTASAMEADVEQTMALGIEEYVVKPMEIQRFVNFMCELASRFTKH